VEDYEPVIALAAKAVEAQPDTNQFLNTLGAILLRAGRPEEALARLEELQDRREANDEGTTRPHGRTWYFLAMAHHAVGNDKQAREYLNKANRWADEVLADEEKPPPWNRRATLEMLRNEAETLLESGDPKPPEDDPELKPKTNGQVEPVQEQD
jgi:tetratricopeptide (TPR) repeat protein